MPDTPADPEPREQPAVTGPGPGAHEPEPADDGTDRRTDAQREAAAEFGGE